VSVRRFRTEAVFARFNEFVLDLGKVLENECLAVVPAKGLKIVLLLLPDVIPRRFFVFGNPAVLKEAFVGP